MGYMMDSQQMLHRPPGDPAFHNQYAHYPAEYYGHHMWGKAIYSLVNSYYWYYYWRNRRRHYF